MRLPLTPSLSTKDGVSNKNARLTNTLKETTASAEFAVVRPGLALNAEATGVGKGLVVFNNELVSVYGTTLGAGAAGVTETVTFNLTGGFFDIFGVAFLGADEWCMFGDDASDSHVYTGDANGTMTIDESGFDTTQETRTGVWYVNLIATSGTSVVIAKRESLQRSDLPTPFSFSQVDDATYDFYQEVKYMGGYYVAISWNFDLGNAIHWSDDDGVTWSVVETAMEGAVGCFDGANWCFFSGIAGTATWWVDTTTDFSSFTHTEISLSPPPSGGLDASTTCASYFGGYFYLSFFGDFGSVAYATYVSSNGIDFTVMPQSIEITRETATGIIGVGGDYATRTIYEISSGLATAISTGLNQPFAGAANDDSTVVVMGSYDGTDDNYYRIGVSASIDPLATVDGPFFDFAQGVL
jgi:hypothetical protein